MALSGLVLVGFVLGHMAGNLQMFLHPDWINEYAYKLHHLPYGLLWVVRGVLLLTVVAHIVTAVLLVLENRRARPASYTAKGHLQATFASRTMRYSGLILLFFIIFHLMHFTIQNIHPEFRDLETELQIQSALDSLLAHTTTFLIAQRISSVINADQILVLENGRIAARGTHEELLQSSPLYLEIYESQYGEGGD